MAVAVMSESAGKLLAIRATGKLTDEDYKDVLIPRMNETLKAHGSMRFLIYMDEAFDGFEPGAMWEDTKFGFSHLGTAARGKFEKVAVVGGSQWYRRFAQIFGHLMPGEVESFESADIERARQWLNE